MTLETLEPKLEDCAWYHSMDLPGIGPVQGQWDLRGQFDNYTGHIDLAGKTVLDVGTASGFLTFEAERRGAKVISFDAASPDQKAYNPSAGAAFREQRKDLFMRRRCSYQFAHKAFGSRAVLVEGDIYQLSTQVPVCDVAIVGQILVHLRDPLEALRQASLVTKETMIIAEGSFDSHGRPLAVFLGENTKNAWWHLSPEVYRIWLHMLGFDLNKTSKNQYKYLAEDAQWHDGEVWTFVAMRR
jgi:SAM-dependent methyltransferase